MSQCEAIANIIFKIKIMADKQKQRQNNRAADQREGRRSSIHFDFDDRVLNHRGKVTGMYFGQVDRNKNFDGYARYSDYITYGSDEFTLAKEYSDRSPYFKTSFSSSEEHHQPENTTKDNTKEVYFEEKVSTQKSASKKQNNYQHKQEQKIDNAQINVKNNRKSVNFNANKNPTFDDISSIKKKQISNRKSENQIIEILNNIGIDKISSDQQFKHSSKKKYSQIQSKKPIPSQINKKGEPMTIQNKQFQTNQQIPAYKAAQNRIKNELKRLNELKQAKNEIKNEAKNEIKNEIKKQSKNEVKNRMKEDKQEQIDDRYIYDRKRDENRRVTINDKGKIKRPSESLTLDHFQFILPDDLRVQPQSSNKKRERPQVSDEDEKDVEEQPMEMDVIPETKEEQPIIVAPVKVQKPKKRKTKKQKEADVRITDPVKPSKSKSKKSSATKSPKNKKSQPKSLNNQKVKKDENKIKVLQNKKKKIVKEDDKERVIEYVNTENSTSSLNSKYPKRFRSGTLKFWQNQKINYKRGEAIGILCVSRFFEAIGLKDLNKFNCKLDMAIQTQIIAKTYLKPKQIMRFSGFTRNSLQTINKNQNLKYLRLSTQAKTKEVLVTLNDIEMKDINEEVQILEGQDFVIQNNESRPVTIFFELTGIKKDSLKLK